MENRDTEHRRRRGKWKDFGGRVFQKAMTDNTTVLKSSLTGLHAAARILDLGCWDGGTLLSYAPKAATLFGVERSPTASHYARKNGVKVVVGDLNSRLPFASNTFDAVTSNQVIEHLCDTDMFVQESHRVLRPGGYLVVSTENLASWHNIFALLLGWQAFSLTNVSRYSPGLGNPMANLRGGEPLDAGWEHLRIFSYRGLRELAEAHGFQSVSVRGAGYYPFPARVGRADPRHAAFIVARGQKTTG